METIYMNEVHWNKTKEKPTNNLEGGEVLSTLQSGFLASMPPQFLRPCCWVLSTLPRLLVTVTGTLNTWFKSFPDNQAIHTLDPCLPRTSQFPLVSANSSLMGHLKSSRNNKHIMSRGAQTHRNAHSIVLHGTVLIKHFVNWNCWVPFLSFVCLNLFPPTREHQLLLVFIIL